MSVYSIGILESLVDEDDLSPENIEDLIEDDEVEVTDIEIEESSLATAMRISYEATANWNSIIKACAIDELQYLDETGTELIYEGTRWDSFIETAKKFFKNLYEKIKEMFKAAIIKFDQLFKSDKDFYNKYKNDLNIAKSKGFGDRTIKMFKYDFSDIADQTAVIKKDGGSMTLEAFLNAIGVTVGTDLDSWKAARTNADQDKIASGLDKVRGEFVGTTSVEDKDFVETIKTKLQGGEDNKVEVALGTALDEAIKHFTGAKYKEILTKNLNAYKASIDADIKALETIKKMLNKEIANGDNKEVEHVKSTLITKAIDFSKAKKQIFIKGTGVSINCLKSAAKQSKSIATAALVYKEKESVNASGLFIQEEGSLLDNIKFR